MADGEWLGEAPDCSLVCYGLRFGVWRKVWGFGFRSCRLKIMRLATKSLMILILGLEIRVQGSTEVSEIG